MPVCVMTTGSAIADVSDVSFIEVHIMIEV